MKSDEWGGQTSCLPLRFHCIPSRWYCVLTRRRTRRRCGRLYRCISRREHRWVPAHVDYRRLWLYQQHPQLCDSCEFYPWYCCWYHRIERQNSDAWCRALSVHARSCHQIWQRGWPKKRGACLDRSFSLWARSAPSGDSNYWLARTVNIYVHTRDDRNKQKKSYRTMAKNYWDLSRSSYHRPCKQAPKPMHQDGSFPF